MKWKGALFILAFMGGLLLNKQPVAESISTQAGGLETPPRVTLLQISDMVMSLFSILDQAQVALSTPLAGPVTDSKPANSHQLHLLAGAYTFSNALSASLAFPTKLPLHLYLGVLRI